VADARPGDFRDCWKPELALRNLVALGYAERDGCAYLRWISRQRALTYMEDHRALAVWCSVDRARPRLDKRRMWAASAGSSVSARNGETGVPEVRPHREVIQGEGFRAAVNLIRRMRVA
jgi:hypothetical protein